MKWETRQKIKEVIIVVLYLLAMAAVSFSLVYYRLLSDQDGRYESSYDYRMEKERGQYRLFRYEDTHHRVDITEEVLRR
jgi:hypothetical protein